MKKYQTSPTTITSPVIYFAFSESNKSTWSITSDGCSCFCIICWLIIFSSCLSVTPAVKSVLIGPGAIQFTVILKLESSLAKVLL